MWLTGMGWSIRERGGLMTDGFEPKFLICTECNEEFVFTIAAQEYFAERGYSEDPKRCKACHTKYKKAHREQRQRQASGVPHFDFPD